MTHLRTITLLVLCALCSFSDGRLSLCEQKLGGSRRLAMLPNMSAAQEPVPMKAAVCGLNLVCCDVGSLNSAIGQIARYDLASNAATEAAQAFQRDPVELLKSVVGWLSSHAFTFEQDISVLEGKLAEKLSELVTPLDNQNVVVRAGNLVNSFVGYFAGLLCSMCDPYHQLYVEQDGDGLSLHIRDPICSDISKGLLSFSSALHTVLSDPRNIATLQALFKPICLHAGEPSNLDSRFPRKGMAGCHALVSDIGHVGRMVSTMNVSLVSLIGCNSTSTCNELLCGRVLQGMAFSTVPLAARFQSAVKEYCGPWNNCSSEALSSYLPFIFPSDDVLANQFHFTEGPAVTNIIVKNHSEIGVDVQKMGCGKYLSQSACTFHQDLTFVKAHMTGIAIAAIVLAGTIVVIAGVAVCINRNRAKRRTNRPRSRGESDGSDLRETSSDPGLFASLASITNEHQEHLHED